MSDEYTELERLARYVASSFHWNQSTFEEFHKECSPEVILNLVQKARVQTQLVEALEELIEYSAIPAQQNLNYAGSLKVAKAALAAAKETQ